MNKEIVKFIKKHPEALKPVQMSNGAGAYDVTAVYSEHNLYLNKVKYMTGLAVELPKGYRLMIQPRGSFTKSDWVMQNTPGLVDEDYRGDISVVFQYVGTKDFQDPPYKVGDRIAQVYIEKVVPIEWEEVEELSETVRGEGAYGSTGV